MKYFVYCSSGILFIFNYCKFGAKSFLKSIFVVTIFAGKGCLIHCPVLGHVKGLFLLFSLQILQIQEGLSIKT